MQVSDRLLVLFCRELGVCLNCSIAIALQLGSDLEYLFAWEVLVILFLVVWEVLVGVTSRVWLFLWERIVVVTFELAAVFNQALPRWLVVLYSLVFNLAYNRLACFDFAKDNVLAIQMWGLDRGEEELRSIGACRSHQTMCFRKLELLSSYLVQRWPC